MKVKITIDCTPVEARALMGLPDVTPLHDLYLDRMKSLVEDGVTPELVGTVVKSWSTLGDAGLGMIQQLLGQVGGAMTGGLTGNRGSSGTSGNSTTGTGGRKR